jgi:hypothetical protein
MPGRRPKSMNRWRSYPSHVLPPAMRNAERIKLSGKEEGAQRLTTSPIQLSGGDRGKWRAATYCCLTMSTEISTAGVVPLFSSQCMVLLSSGQPSPGP